MKVRIERGDITELDVEAIVNAANNRGIMGGGVAGAIRRKGGIEIEEEARSKAPWPVGDAIVTGAGKLKAKYVIHAATMELDFKTNEEIIRKATRSALKKAKELGVKSVAFPALGAGVGGIPIEKVTRVMLEEILKEKDEPEEIMLVFYGEEDYRKALEVAKGFGIGG
jgi:O-acetyl-ADP-ribose deacetylase (regulator of RNase III)